MWGILLFFIRLVCWVIFIIVFVVLKIVISKKEKIIVYRLWWIIFLKVVKGFEIIKLSGRWGEVNKFLLNESCFLKKVINFVIIILKNKVLFIFSVYKMIVIVSLISVKIIFLDCKLLSLIKFDLFVIIILVEWSLIKVINKLILVLIVCFKLFGIVLINFLWNDVNDRMIKIMFVMNIVEKVVV